MRGVPPTWLWWYRRNNYWVRRDNEHMTATASESSKPVPPEDPPLDTASCANCHAVIERTYFRANAHVVCPKCRVGLATPPKEGGALRFWRAFGLGLGAGVIGGGIWYAVSATTGYQIGFIGIIVGLLVGGAVRKGSNARGGWGYQILAMVLTYLTISATYVPGIIDEYDKAASGQLPAPAQDSAPAMRTVGSAPGTPPPAARPLHAPRGFIIFLAILFSVAAPFFSGIMGLVIVGIALYEAWKINKRATFAFAGPFALGPPPAPEPPVPA